MILVPDRSEAFGRFLLKKKLRAISCIEDNEGAAVETWRSFLSIWM